MFYFQRALEFMVLFFVNLCIMMVILYGAYKLFSYVMKKYFKRFIMWVIRKKYPSLLDLISFLRGISNSMWDEIKEVIMMEISEFDIRVSSAISKRFPEDHLKFITILDNLFMEIHGNRMMRNLKKKPPTEQHTVLQTDL